MQTRRIALGALGVMLGASPASPVAAQPVADDQWIGAVETLYTQLRLDGDGRAVSAPGILARIMWRPVEVLPSASSVLARTNVGFYGMHTPQRDFQGTARFSSFELGVTADVRPLATPLAGRVDPVLMLGTGVLHTDVNTPVRDAPTPLLDGSGAAFTLTPGVGARVRLGRNVALQGEVRDLVTFRDDTRHNLALGAGLRLRF